MQQLLPEQWNGSLPSMLTSCHFDEVLLSERSLSQGGDAWLSLFRSSGLRRICGGACTNSTTQDNMPLDVGNLVGWHCAVDWCQVA
jgi:hypothetical protein